MALKKLLDLEKGLGRGLERLTRRKGTPREALELIPEILDEIEKHAEPVGGGVRVFPSSRVVIRVHVPGGRAEAARAVFAHPPSLEERVLERLRESGCDPSGVRVKLEVLEREAPESVGERTFEIRYAGRRTTVAGGAASGRSRARGGGAVETRARTSGGETAGTTAALAKPEDTVPTVGLEVSRGKAQRRDYQLTLTRINLGRMETVVDKNRRTMRHNDVAFLDARDEINLSVSRAHAHIEFSAGDGEFRLYDDGSAQGTRVIRRGRSYQVPRRAGRGMKLRHGDELELGRARLRFATRQE
jgi:hypothetical protein